METFKSALFVLLAVLLAIGVALGFQTVANATPAPKVTLCHATGSETNPYVVITVAAAGAYNGHIAHQHSEDIIPPFEYQGETYSQNWDAVGQAIYAAGCEVEAEPSPSPSPSPSPDPDPTDTPEPPVDDDPWTPGWEPDNDASVPPFGEAPEGDLAETGNDVTVPLIAGGVLLAIGMGALYLSRKRFL